MFDPADILTACLSRPGRISQQQRGLPGSSVCLTCSKDTPSIALLCTGILPDSSLQYVNSQSRFHGAAGWPIEEYGQEGMIEVDQIIVDTPSAHIPAILDSDTLQTRLNDGAQHVLDDLEYCPPTPRIDKGKHCLRESSIVFLKTNGSTGALPLNHGHEKSICF